MIPNPPASAGRTSVARTLLTLVCLSAAVLVTVSGCRGGGGGPLELDVGFHEGEHRILGVLTRGVADGEQLRLRVRPGQVGELDCATMHRELERIDGDRVDDQPKPSYRGPVVDPSVFEPVLDSRWLEVDEPTPEMIEDAAKRRQVIEVCLMEGNRVVRQGSFDIRRALDKAGEDGKFDGSEEERIASTEAYAEACVAALGEIPFFPRIGEGDYDTYNCLESVPIPTLVTDANGDTTRPTQSVSQCDAPQYLTTTCEAHAVDGMVNGPRVTRATNEDGTHWVLLCRKSRETEGQYNDIAMIGHNPFTGKTCYFQNDLGTRFDGLHVPHPGDRDASDASPQQSASLWSGIHGGLGSGIACADCHDSDPFIHTPWIDGALNEDGDPVVPKMGVDNDFALGWNDAPYTIINTEGQGWTMPQQLVSPEAAACTNCHRIGNRRWMQSWIDRLDGTSQSWTNATTEAHRDFAHTFWMPPDLDGLDEQSWPDSAFAKAMEKIRACASDAAGCEWAPLPTEPITGGGNLPGIDLVGEELALESLKILGASVQDPSCPGGDCATRRCAECHAVSRPGLRNWLRLTEKAWGACGLGDDPTDMTSERAREIIDCLRVEPSDDESVFASEKLGILSTGVAFGQFRDLFRLAYTDGWLPKYLRFTARVGMPKGAHPKLSQREYATLFKWFKDDLISLDRVLQEKPPPSTCSPSIDSDAVASHIDTMRFEGWGAVNAENGVSAFGCPSGDALNCFASGSFPDRTSAWGTSAGTVRELASLNFRTSFWTRTSADGRFVGNGGGPSGATITDLQAGRNIGVVASYDPGFFPDNSGFMFQGATGGAGICAQSLLVGGDDRITFDESQCVKSAGINLYQHVARGLGGGDYFVINSQFTSDPGDDDVDPVANFSESSTMKFTPMIFNGSTYDTMPAVVVPSPYEGDSVLSPSSQLVISRLAGADGNSLGFVVRSVKATPAGDSYDIDLGADLATICAPGAKANVSFDERSFVTHHYENGTANIYLFDLQTGQGQRVTDMPSGQRALFPHFVTSGWVYFLVVDDNGARHVAALDAALRL